VTSIPGDPKFVIDGPTYDEHGNEITPGDDLWYLVRSFRTWA